VSDPPLRLFVSSPSDVPDERRRVELVVERLNGEFVGRARIEVIRWETSYYSAHETFQKQIPEAADCDLVVALFRARLGTPLPAGFPRQPNGEPYPSGTAYEVLSAIRARQAGQPQPDIFVFRYPSPPTITLDSADRAEIEAQWARLKAFFDAWFKTPDGQFVAAFQNYDSTDAATACWPSPITRASTSPSAKPPRPRWLRSTRRRKPNCPLWLPGSSPTSSPTR
jgi:hypothetical protein